MSRRNEIARTLTEALRYGLGERLDTYNRRWGSNYGSLSEIAFDLLDPHIAYSHSTATKDMLSTPEVVDAMRLALFWMSRG